MSGFGPLIEFGATPAAERIGREPIARHQIGRDVTNKIDLSLTKAEEALAAAATAQSTADGKIVTYYQTEPPSTGSEGDLWIDTNDGNKLYRHSGTEWIAARDTGIAEAIDDAAGAQATADGKVTTFYADEPPTAEGIGDLWVDTNDNNHLHRWSGTAWVSIRDLVPIDNTRISVASDITRSFTAGRITMPSTLNPDSTYGVDILLPATVDFNNISVVTSFTDWLAADSTWFASILADGGLKLTLYNTGEGNYVKNPDGTFSLWNSDLNYNQYIIGVVPRAWWDKRGQTQGNTIRLGAATQILVYGRGIGESEHTHKVIYRFGTFGVRYVDHYIGLRGVWS